MTAISPDISKVPAPLLIGVTGHRDLRPEDLERLGQQVRELLRGLRARYASTPFVLLSPLAEGADRLAARIALEPEIGGRLVVPLPMAKHLYEKDFQSPESLADFQELLKRAEHSFEMRMLACENEVSRAGAARDRQYEEVGKYIARESQILIALWDGTRSDKVGGTAEIVEFQLRGIQSGPDCNLQPPELFPVYHIVTPRQSNPHTEGEPFQLIKKYPEGFNSVEEAETYYGKAFRNLDEFNKCVLNGGDSLVSKATKSKSELLRKFDQANLSPAETIDLDRYAVADALAQRFQREMLRVHRALHWLVFAAFMCFVLFAHLPEKLPSWLPEKPAWLVGSFALLLIISFVHMYSRERNLDIKSQDYRAIAEGSRVRFFWHLAGVPDSVADNYLGEQRTELDWIRNGLRGWELETYSSAQPSQLPKQLVAVRYLWISAQIKYFRHAIESNEKKLEKMEMLVRGFGVLLLIALGILGILLGCGFPQSELSIHGEHLWKDGLIIAVDFFLAAGALLHHATHQRAYAEHIKQFRRMKTVFHKARKLVNQKRKGGDFGGVRQCLLKLGQEALSENGDWVLLHRERPLELPHP